MSRAFRTVLVLSLVVLVGSLGLLIDDIRRRRYAGVDSNSILLIYNSQENPAFIQQARRGVAEARSQMVRDGRSDILAIREWDLALDPQLPPLAHELIRVYYDLSRVISQELPVGIISTTTSLTAEPVISVCKELKIPLLLVVASGDELLDSGTRGIVFRLVPNNAQQLDAIGQWLSNYPTAAVLYENNDYGRPLVRGLRARRGSARVQTFSIDDETSLATVVQYFRQFGLTACVFLGYSDLGRELLLRLEDANLIVPVLLSDGNYSEAVVRQASMSTLSVQICFGRPRIEAGFGSYAADGYELLDRLSSQSLTFQRNSLVEALNAIVGPNGDDTVGPAAAALPYKFDELGETGGRYFVVALNEGRGSKE